MFSCLIKARLGIKDHILLHLFDELFHSRAVSGIVFFAHFLISFLTPIIFVAFKITILGSTFYVLKIKSRPGSEKLVQLRVLPNLWCVRNFLMSLNRDARILIEPGIGFTMNANIAIKIGWRWRNSRNFTSEIIMNNNTVHYTYSLQHSIRTDKKASSTW